MRLQQGDALCSALAERLEREPCLCPLDAADAPLFSLFELSNLAATRGGAHLDPEQLMQRCKPTGANA